MLDAAPVLRAVPGSVLPIADMVMGAEPEDAADLLPRVFNLCRTAQSIAARAAFGLELAPDWQKALRQEILREHVLKLCLKWPGMLSLPALTLPRDWQTHPTNLPIALFGPEGALPSGFDGFMRWSTEGAGIAPLIHALSTLFGPGEGVRDALPRSTALTVFDPVLQENSAAARHADHSVLRGIEARWGRGPLWSAMGAAYDLQAVLGGTRLPLHRASGWAVVPAARGLYGVRARLTDGRISAFERITPTDHLLAQGGALDCALANLPAEKQRFAPLLLSVMDPCFPVRLETAREVANA